MVAAGDHRRGGAAPERGEGRGKRKGRSTAHPGSTRTARTTTGAEEGSGAARVDEDGGVPAVGGRNGGVDEVSEDAAEPKEAMPKRDEVRGDDGGGPELGGDGGERGRRRELESDGERERRVAETEEGGTGSAYIALGVREGGRMRGNRPRKIRPPLMRRRGSRE
ncbi:Os12g0282583 [Oryza sativa Japonica Group]|uniref:Os12g0282583 protein n=1 Tax=Oryza sativa subsp. japonica TaxID=39947 RepID=A0A0P0Y9M4_ORYSJ|nr:Os12g0282583 [Oryza sativa Japonica Group]